LVIRSEPRESLIESVSRGGAGWLDVPVSVSDPRQTQFLLDLVGLHRVRQILLIGEYEYDAVPHLAIVDDSVEFLARLVDSVSIGAIHYEDQPLSPRVIMPPQRTDLVLAAHVPHVEFYVLIGDCFYVESDGGYCGNTLA